MTGTTSPIGQVAGIATTAGATTALLANTGNPIFQTLLLGFILMMFAVFTTRVTKVAISKLVK